MSQHFLACDFNVPPHRACRFYKQFRGTHENPTIFLKVLNGTVAIASLILTSVRSFLYYLVHSWSVDGCVFLRLLRTILLWFYIVNFQLSINGKSIIRVAPILFRHVEWLTPHYYYYCWALRLQFIGLLLLDFLLLDFSAHVITYWTFQLMLDLSAYSIVLDWAPTSPICLILG